MKLRILLSLFIGATGFAGIDYCTTTPQILSDFGPTIAESLSIVSQGDFYAKSLNGKTIRSKSGNDFQLSAHSFGTEQVEGDGVATQTLKTLRQCVPSGTKLYLFSSNVRSQILLDHITAEADLSPAQTMDRGYLVHDVQMERKIKSTYATEKFQEMLALGQYESLPPWVRAFHKGGWTKRHVEIGADGPYFFATAP